MPAVLISRPFSILSALAVLAPLATACASIEAIGGRGASHNVEARMIHTTETFNGTTTATLSGDGTLAMVSDKGTRCGGTYQQVHDDNTAEVQAAEERKSGRANLSCDDGRTGSVLFLVGDDEAVGTGMLGTETLTMTIDE